MKTIKAKDVRNLKTLKAYLTQVMGNCKRCRKMLDGHAKYTSLKGDFCIAVYIDYFVTPPRPSYYLFYKGDLIAQDSDLRNLFRRFIEKRRQEARLRREEDARIRRTIQGIGF